MAKKQTAATSVSEFTPEDKALVLAAMKRAQSVLESKENGGAAPKLGEGGYPIDITLSIRGDINVGAGSEVAGSERVTISSGDVLGALFSLLPKRSREETIAEAIRLIATARKKGDTSDESVAIANAGNELQALTETRARKHGLVETTEGTTRAGAVTGKPDVFINASVIGTRRSITYRIGKDSKAA